MKTYTSEEVLDFLNSQLEDFRKWIKESETVSEQEYHIRACNTISYLKCMWSSKVEKDKNI